MDSSVAPKDEIWFLRVCHHVSNAVYILFTGKQRQRVWAVLQHASHTTAHLFISTMLINTRVSVAEHRANSIILIRLYSNVQGSLWGEKCEMRTRNSKYIFFFCKLKLEADVSFLCRPYILVKAVVMVVTFFLNYRHVRFCLQVTQSVLPC
jgi:hypothetical protein